jgi:hypothetical protein
MHQLSSENCVTSARLISILLLEYERVDFLFFSPSTVWGLEKLPTAGISARGGKGRKLQRKNNNSSWLGTRSLLEAAAVERERWKMRVDG